ncbi:hypothetical protein ACWEO2_12735 [Nocardia sp. NPDC004278]
MLPKTSTSFRRGFARVAIAGALAAIPLSALVVTASAATADSSVPAVQDVSDQIPLQGTDIDGPDRGDWDGPRGDWDGRAHHHHHRGPDDQHDGPWQPWQPPALPPTGSAG